MAGLDMVGAGELEMVEFKIVREVSNSRTTE